MFENLTILEKWALLNAISGRLVEIRGGELMLHVYGAEGLALTKMQHALLEDAGIARLRSKPA